MAKFEIVSRFADLDSDEAIHLPVRATAHAAGYDFAAAENYVLNPYSVDMNTLSTNQFGEGVFNRTDLIKLAKLTSKTLTRPALVATGIKAKLAEDEYLEISARSSLPLKHWLILANGVGIIDSDYYNNPSNEGEIFFQLINLSPFYIEINKGDFIGQGIIKKYIKTEDDIAGAERTGGFGSTH